MPDYTNVPQTWGEIPARESAVEASRDELCTTEYHLVVHHYPQKDGSRPLRLLPISQRDLDAEIEASIRSARMVAYSVAAVVCVAVGVILRLLIH